MLIMCGHVNGLASLARKTLETPLNAKGPYIKLGALRKIKWLSLKK